MLNRIVDHKSHLMISDDVADDTTRLSSKCLFTLAPNCNFRKTNKPAKNEASLRYLGIRKDEAKCFMRMGGKSMTQ